ncbi:MAG TPA: DUF2336 domain-containing protein [Xanthobacteraceae bacterium]|nr:DUF2336 domain-containing protein [Xanthobacteraceae bacterium]
MTAQYAIIQELEDALAHGSADRRVKTLRRVTDLFVFGSGHFTKDHVAVFDNVFNHLIADIEQSARVTLARRLAGVGNAPPQVIRTLAFDDAIEVAGPVLTRSELLDNVTLVENAKSKSQQHLLAISRRRVLPETVTDVLVERGNRDVALSTAQNAGAKFSEAGYVRLVKRSEGDDALAQAVGSRPEIPRAQFLKLLTSASNTVRAALEAANPGHASQVRDVVAEVAGAIQAKTAIASRDYAAAQALIGSMQAAHRLSEIEVEAFARVGKFEEVAVALAVMCGLSIDVVERVMVQESTETILIIAKAVGLSWPTTKAILMLSADKRVMPEHILDQCRMVFNKLRRDTALQVVKFQQQRQAIHPAAG